MAKGTKATKAESALRTNEVYGMLSLGHSRTQICEFLREKYGLSERSADNYIARARDQLLKDAEMERPAWVAEALQRLRTYEQAAAKRGQMQVAINSITQQGKMIGLDV
jgi:hypothetical protein